MKTFNIKSLAMASLLTYGFAGHQSSIASNPESEIVNKPNIVFIFADDMGYGDVSGLNPLARTQTPAIDKLIDEGITL